MDIYSWTVYIAGYAALVATIDLIWRILEWLEKQAKIKVKVSGGLLTSGPKVSEPMILITVINKGKSPTTITSVGFKAKSGKTMIIIPDPSVPLPHRLKENDKYECWTDLRKLIYHEEILLPLVAWCNDAIGNRYFSKKYKIKREEWS